MSQTRMFLVSFLVLAIVAIANCISPTTCKGSKETRYGEGDQSASNPKWEANDLSVRMTVEYEPRAKRCLEACGRRCKSHWTGCAAFSSWIDESYSGQCFCYGWDHKPDIKPWDGYRAGWCMSGWFETGTL